MGTFEYIALLPYMASKLLVQSWLWIWGYVEHVHRADGLWPLIGIALCCTIYVFFYVVFLDIILPKLLEACSAIWTIGSRRANFRHAMRSLGVIPDLDVSLFSRQVIIICIPLSSPTYPIFDSVFRRKFTMDKVMLGARQCGMCSCGWCKVQYTGFMASDRELGCGALGASSG